MFLTLLFYLFSNSANTSAAKFPENLPRGLFSSGLSYLGSYFFFLPAVGSKLKVIASTLAFSKSSYPLSEF